MTGFGDNMMTDKERLNLARKILSRELTQDDITAINEAQTPSDVREICYGIARSPAYYADSYKGKAELKATFLAALCKGHGVDVTLIKEAFYEALKEYLETIEGYREAVGDDE